MELVATCAICQKYRLGMVDNLSPVIRHLKPALHHRSVIGGCDTLKISPRDKFGNFYTEIIVNHTANNLAKLYIKSEKTAVLTATSLFQ